MYALVSVILYLSLLRQRSSRKCMVLWEAGVSRKQHLVKEGVVVQRIFHFYSSL